MAITEILVPQMGEGLTEVRVLAFLKAPGASVERDEPIYSMETDKATMEVESPVAGVLSEWLAEEGAILPIGAPIAKLDTLEVAAPAFASQAAPEEAARIHHLENKKTSVVQIPPRTRLHAKKLGLADADLRGIPAAGATLLPADVDRWLSVGKQTAPAAAYRDSALSEQQRTFVYRMRRSAQTVIPGTVGRPVGWSGVRRTVEAFRAAEPDFRVSEFQVFAYGVAQVVQGRPKLRSTLLNDETVREWERSNLGIAVARDNGELVTAVVHAADAMGFREFVAAAQERIQQARDGQDQADSSVQILLTYMGAFDIVFAVPVLVAPAVAVLFTGAVYETPEGPAANLALTFDHRLINGVEAATFLADVVERTVSIEAIAK